MKRVISIILIAVMFVGTFAAAAKPAYAASGLKIAKKKVEMRANESVKVKYISAKKIKAFSKNEKIAKVKVVKKKIVITGLKEGKTEIKVKAAGKKAIIKVTVNKSAADIKKIEEALKQMDVFSLPVNRFSCNIFNGMKKNNSNTFVSPFSLHMALSMLVNGAEQETKNQLLSALGISDLSDFNNRIKGILGGSSDEKVILNISNAIWINNNFETAENIENDFINPVKNYYNSEIKKNVKLDTTDFVNEVNKWASDKTNGMIKEVLKDPLSKDAAMFLANAVYFMGKWKYPFDKNYTFEKDFNGVNGKKRISMMSRGKISGKYFKDDKFVGASIPYGSGNYEMDILMSADTNTTAGKVWESLSVNEQLVELANFENEKNIKEINLLQIPKFELEKEYSDEIKGALKKLGVENAFDRDIADFTKIGKNLFISKIKQNAKLKVDESGTEAAAVTTITMDVATAVREPVKVIEFIVDRPFIFTIRDSISGMILFIGEVNDI